MGKNQERRRQIEHRRQKNKNTDIMGQNRDKGRKIRNKIYKNGGNIEYAEIERKDRKKKFTSSSRRQK